MRGWINDLGWAGLGALFGGWMSALLSTYILLAPAGLLNGATDGVGLAAVARHAHQLVLAGLPMGAAAIVCLVRYLRLRSPLGMVVMRWVAVLPVVCVLLGLPLTVFSGSVAGLFIDGHQVCTLTMDNLPSGQAPVVRAGQFTYACSRRFSRICTSFRDGSAVVAVRYQLHYFPWDR